MLEQDGKQSEQIVDTFEEGGFYVLVFHSYARLADKYIHNVVNLDAIKFDETGIISPADFADPENLFTPAPNDEDTIW